ncbi:MAG: SdrD B-like domain-containing protein, partial [Planctomycetia bacterium]|nr:SdrD B-like domain-containing protein [Planctomycetia bacterium]
MSIFRFFGGRAYLMGQTRRTESVTTAHPRRNRRLCRIEQMEKRTLLAFDPSGLVDVAVDADTEVLLTAIEEDAAPLTTVDTGTDGVVNTQTTARLSAADVATTETVTTDTTGTEGLAALSTVSDTATLTGVSDTDASTDSLSASTELSGSTEQTTVTGSTYVAPDPIHAGLVYSEDNYAGQTNDTQPDTFIFGWTGGADDTRCTEITLNVSDGLLFDLDTTSDVTNGKYGGFTCEIDRTRSDSDIDFDQITITQTSGQIRITFADGYGLTAGQKLYITVDLDRVISDGLYGSDVNGIDLQAYLTWGASFDHSQYSTPEILDQGMSDSYTTPDALTGVLPADGWNSDAENAENKTAGGFAEIEQTPLPCTIAGTVWADLSLDCTVDDATTERRFSGVTITLTSTDGSVSRTTTTDENGYYEFTDLDPTLVYTVTESTQPENYYDSPKPCGTSEREGVQPEPAGTVTVNFAEIPYASLSGHVWEDNDNDGVRDEDESAIAGATVYLLDENGDRTGKVATTDSSGYYEFTSLTEGTYGLEQILPEGYYNGTYAVGTITTVVDDPAAQTGTKTTLSDEETDVVTGIVLSRGAVGTVFDFGELPPAEIVVTVWSDLSQDCTIDEDEERISGVEVTLYDSDGTVVATGVTGEDGTYTFGDLDPRVTYTLTETSQPQGYYDSPKSCGTNEKTDLNPPAGGTLTTQIAELPYTSISGYVWADANNDGVWDEGEIAISGATVYLLDENGERIDGKVATTDESGYYEFTSLEAGVFGLEELLPDGYINGKSVPGVIRDLDGNDTGNDTGSVSVTGTTSFIQLIELTAGSKGVNFDFGEMNPASLEGLVYHDEDYDGVYDEGEDLLSGVEIKLVASDGTVLTATTDSNGVFRFDNLTPFETYSLVETQPDGYLDARETVGTAGGEASEWVWSPYTDNDTITGIIPGNGFAATGYHFGEVKAASISGHVFQDGDAVEYEEGEEKPSVEDTDKTGVYKDG